METVIRIIVYKGELTDLRKHLEQRSLKGSTRHPSDKVKLTEYYLTGELGCPYLDDALENVFTIEQAKVGADNE